MFAIKDVEDTASWVYLIENFDGEEIFFFFSITNEIHKNVK